MARAGLGLTAHDLAKLAGVGYATVARFEAGSAISAGSLADIERALSDAGAQFSRRASRVGVAVPE